MKEVIFATKIKDISVQDSCMQIIDTKGNEIFVPMRFISNIELRETCNGYWCKQNYFYRIFIIHGDF